jgi:hypothetical protein
MGVSSHLWFHEWYSPQSRGKISYFSQQIACSFLHIWLVRFYTWLVRFHTWLVLYKGVGTASTCSVQRGWNCFHDVFCTKGLELLPRQLFIFYWGGLRNKCSFSIEGTENINSNEYFCQHEVFRPCFLPNDRSPIRKTLLVICALYMQKIPCDQF